MTQSEVEAFVEALENVQRDENYGYIFYYVGDDHTVPFVSIAETNNEYETISDLDREGVFRINIGLPRASFRTLFPDPSTEGLDYTALNVLLPHPDYASQNYVCILNPAGDNVALTQKLMLEAHAKAAARS